MLKWTASPLPRRRRVTDAGPPMNRLLNVATPLIAATVVVPPRTPPPDLAMPVTLTALCTVSNASSTWTVTAGLIEAGRCRWCRVLKARLAAAGAMLNVLDVARQNHVNRRQRMSDAALVDGKS